ncbi:type VI secretion system baseplate subunit TssF [Trinickia caryophylli]|uniref:Type VI secretion system protein ImpG n=1 Tax=Trinickia caryophylli TaxID=28094 RepID=A0A1X7CPE1_TRICW|nr:type VI secretion system baseplate subunit TssF [Trinickia caryophylli]PMS11290.1 type VI secretion system baseplate subunit TssF [Trinickia caryophylli]TRX16771.1 type VI secretion system baseplate subunit TssF [Trinickia caryophylli]WQE12507.1 type VI secretion system baseplate subunit TssF [Trinickia caryophylli]SMF00242.1 type VI secretion system protein ImpG [Trinickia caryophylli]GLU30189.1 hypothetical protein Busp01_00310 [Trinickia caryophylli]
MEELLAHYERELALLRRSMQSFAARYPKIAARLAISGEHSEDPHVERMLQSFALLAARIDTKLEDDYPELTEALVDILYPQYLRAFPASAIAQFKTDAFHDKLTAPATVERGTALMAKAADCRFRTVYDVVLAPVHLAHAGYRPTPSAPPGITLPAETTAAISIGFASIGQASRLDKVAPGVMRVHLSGPREVVAALSDVVRLKAAAAYVEADGSGRWTPLAKIPVSSVGFGENESMAGRLGDAPPAFRSLMEYFAFPEKFDFLDIDMAALLAAAGPCQSVTLHLAIAELHPDSRAAQRIAKLDAGTFKLFATPVVNLFERDTTPIKIAPDTKHYSLFANVDDMSVCEVFSIDAVYTNDPAPARNVTIAPMHSLRHGSTAALDGPYWTAVVDRWSADPQRRTRPELVFVGLDGAPIVPPFGQVAVDMTCTNGELPASLPIGLPGGDLESETSELARDVALLTRPTQPLRLPRGNGALWRLIAQMTPHSLDLDAAGLEALKELLREFAALSPSRSPQIEGIVSLAARATMQWLTMEPSPAFARGLEIRVTVDEHAFAASSLYTFAGIMDRFFAPYAPANSFVQIVLVSKNYGNEIVRCAPRPGDRPLI